MKIDLIVSRHFLSFGSEYHFRDVAWCVIKNKLILIFRLKIACPPSTITAIRLCLWDFFHSNFQTWIYKHIWYLILWNFHIIIILFINWIDQNESVIGYRREHWINLIRCNCSNQINISEIKLCINIIKNSINSLFIYILLICKIVKKHWIGSCIENWIYSSISVIDIWTLNT